MWMVLVSLMETQDRAFAAALDEQDDNVDSKLCPCLFNRTLPVVFRRGLYFCDAGNEEFMDDETGLQTDPLWDGAGLSLL